MAGPHLSRDRRERWTEVGRGASLLSQRQDFAAALQHQGRAGDNSGRSTVYAYLRDRDSCSGRAGSPYYVGVAGDVARPYSSHGRTPVPTDERRIRLLRQNVTHEQAREWEKHYIQHFGRRDIGSGRQMLINHTDGGDGSAGIKMSASSRAKMSEAKKGQVRSAETKAKISAFQQGQTRSEETRARMSASLSRRSTEDRKSKEGAARRRNVANQLGIDPSVYDKLTKTQRTNLYSNGKKLGLSPAQYLEKMRVRWGV